MGFKPFEITFFEKIMMKFLYRIIFCILLLITPVIVFASNTCRQDIDNCMQFFYQSPSTDKLIQITAAPAHYGSQVPLQTFITLALYKNPNITKDIVNQFSQLSPRSQQLVLNALYS